MIQNLLLVVVLSILILGFIIVLTKKAIEAELAYYDSLPTLEEAQEMVAQTYPNHAHCFSVAKKASAGFHSHWGGTFYTYRDFLVCKDLGVSIRIKSEEKMS